MANQNQQAPSGFLGMGQYIDPELQQAAINKQAQLDYANQYPVDQRGAVEAGQGVGAFLRGIVGHYRGNSEASPDQGFLSNLRQAIAQTGQSGMNQTFPAIAPQQGDGSGYIPQQADDGCGYSNDSSGGNQFSPQPNGMLSGGSPDAGNFGGSLNYGNASNSAPNNAPSSASPPTGGLPNAPIPRSPGANTSQLDTALSAYYQSQINTTGDELLSRIATLKMAVKAGRYGAGDQLAAAQTDLTKRNQIDAQSYKDNSAGVSSSDEPRHRVADETNATAVLAQRTDIDNRKLAQEQATANAAAASKAADPALTASSVAAVLTYRMPMPSGQFLRTPQGQAIYMGVLSHPEYDATKYADKNKTVGQYTPGGTEGKSLSAFNVALEHGQVLMDNVAGLNNGQSQSINAIKNLFGSSFGATGPGGVALAAHLYSSELEKTVLSTGGTKEERDAIKTAFSNVNTPEQFQVAVNVSNSLLVGKVQNSRMNWQNHIGNYDTGPSQFESKFLGNSAQAITKANARYQSQFPADQQQQQGALGTNGGTQLPGTNQQGWTLHTDAKGNQAYVSPDGKKVQQVGSK